MYPATHLIVRTPRMRNELRYYEPKTARKQASCVSPIKVILEETALARSKEGKRQILTGDFLLVKLDHLLEPGI